MKLGEAEHNLRNQLEKVYPPGEAASIAIMVIEHLTSFTRTERLMQRHKELSPVQIQQMEHYTHRLLMHEPVQYVLEEAWFYGLRLFVDQNVLIPRPETEELADWIIRDIKANGKEGKRKKPFEADQTTELKILDVGTGSGCIALALKKHLPKAEVWGCDISDKALNVARRNGSELDIRVDFVGLNFLNERECKQLPTVDVLVSNPPYIPEKDKETMHRNVLAFEPHTALFVPNNNALLFYEAIARFGHQRLHGEGTIYLEIHEDLGKEVVELFEREGYQEIALRKDMQGKDRMVKAKKR